MNRTGGDLDRGVLSNVVGGAFCPGGEVGWVMRNPSIYHAPYRIKADPAFYEFQQTAAQANTSSGASEPEYSSYIDTSLSGKNDFDVGLQPGDLTKYMALPWQADFNECSTQTIDVTYLQWNLLVPDERRRLRHGAAASGCGRRCGGRPTAPWRSSRWTGRSRPDADYQWLRVGARRPADQGGRPEDGDGVVAPGLRAPQPVREPRHARQHPAAAQPAAVREHRVHTPHTGDRRMSANPFVGKWSYRSFYNDPTFHVDKQGNDDFNVLELGFGTLVIKEAGPQELGGTIGGDGWSLKLKGSMADGNPGQVRFQGKGNGRRQRVDLRLHRLAGAGVAQRHRSSGGRWWAPSSAPSRTPTAAAASRAAGVVGSWYAVLQG